MNEKALIASNLRVAGQNILGRVEQTQFPPILFMSVYKLKQITKYEVRLWIPFKLGTTSSLMHMCACVCVKLLVVR